MKATGTAKAAARGLPSKVHAVFAFDKFECAGAIRLG
jgi:hypothetical protein